MSQIAVHASGTTAQRVAYKWTPHVYYWDTDLGCYFGGDGVTLGGVKLCVSLLPAVADVDASSLPADGVIGGLTVSNPPTQAEVQALRDECEKLRDALAASNTTINLMLARMRTNGLIVV